MTTLFRHAKSLWWLIPTFATVLLLLSVLIAFRRIEQELITLRQGLSIETEQKLKDVEDVLNDSKRWPEDPEQAEKLRQELENIVQEVPPAVAEKLLPKLVRLNWGVEGLWNLRTHAHAAGDQLEEVQATIKELLDRHPRGCFKEIQKGLESRMNELKPQVREVQVKRMLERAKLALEDKEDANAAFSSLEAFRTDKDIAAFLPKLRSKVLEKNGRERVATLKTTLDKTLKFGDARARQVSLLTVQDNILRLIVDFKLEDAAPKELIKEATNLLAHCDKELLELSAQQQKANAEKAYRYQAWALKEIRKFDSPTGWYYDVEWFESQLKKFKNASEDEDWVAIEYIPSIKSLIQELVGVDLSATNGAMLTAEKRKEIYEESWRRIGWKNSIHKELAYRATRDGMVKFLLPIQPNLLDPPVAQLYQQAFSKGWQKLEGRDDQLFVAQQSALVKKKTLEEMASYNP